MIGVAASFARNCRTASSVPRRVMPEASARRPAAWIAGPSAIGSVKGMPSSMRSAPATGSFARISAPIDSIIVVSIIDMISARASDAVVG